jgi:hypothetical protein
MVKNGDLHYTEHTFTFKAKSNQTYIVELHEFESSLLWFIKFYLKAHRLSEIKYQLHTGLNEFPGVLSTCINIMQHLYDKNPYISFGFIGMNSLEEALEGSKRFRIYRKAMERCFSPIKFFHMMKKEHSIYLLVNKDFIANNPGTVAEIEALIEKHCQ